MGTWGEGSFDNDTALDWADELAASEDLSLIRSALEAVFADDYVDAGDAQPAIAAAEVLAAVKAGDPEALPEDVQTWFGRVAVAPSADDFALAGRALERILGQSSELPALWEHDEEWMNQIRALGSRVMA